MQAGLNEYLAGKHDRKRLGTARSDKKQHALNSQAPTMNTNGHDSG